MRKFLLATTFIAFGHTAIACDDPSHICVVGYSQSIRYELIGQVGKPSVFTFPPGEKVYHVIISGKPMENGNIGDAAWSSPPPDEKVPLGNNIALFPGIDAPNTTTIMTIITVKQNPPDCVIADGNCEQKPYAFKLHAVDAGTPEDKLVGVTFNLIFQGTTTPPRPAPIAANTPVPTIRVVPPVRPATPPPPAKIAAKPGNETEIVERLRTATLNTTSPKECHYDAHGPGLISFTPPCPTDDGRRTWIHFPGLIQQPAVYVAKDMLCNKYSEERLARQHSDRDYVVVEEVAHFLCLRLGDDVLALINKKYDPAHAPYDLTGVSGVKLELR
jgi:Conjugal transfer protein